MENFNQNLINYIGAFAFMALLIYNVYDKFFSKRAKEHGEADDRLTEIFKTTIAALEVKVQGLSDDLDDTNAELRKIKTDYDVVVKILQGRDTGMIEYQKKGLEIMDKVDKEIMPVIKRLDKYLDKENIV